MAGPRDGRGAPCGPRGSCSPRRRHTQEMTCTRHRDLDARVEAATRRLLREEDAATMVEYALLVVLIAMVVAIAAITLGRAISTQFRNITNCVSNPGNTTCTPP